MTTTDWSRDGQSLLLQVEATKTGDDIWIYSFAEKRATPLIRTPFHETEAVFSPDGSWIAYTSDQSGRPEVYVQSRDGRGQRWQASTAGGAQPSWRADGAELFFIGPDHQLFTVGIKRQGQLELNAPTALFGFREASRSRLGRAYSPTPDGQRFVILTASANSQTPVTLIQNWTEFLRK